MNRRRYRLSSSKNIYVGRANTDAIAWISSCPRPLPRSIQYGQSPVEVTRNGMLWASTGLKNVQGTPRQINLT